MNITKTTAFFTVIALILFGCTSSELPPREQVIELLQTNGGCELPCFWGIKVGETKWDDARIWLSKLTRIYDDKSFYSDGDGGYPANLMTFTLTDEDPTGQFDLILTVGNGRIQRLVFSPGGTIGDIQFLPKFIQNYSLEKIFRQLGKPDSVYAHLCEKYKPSCFDMVVLYEKQKIAIDISGDALPDNQVCPKIGEAGNLTAMNISIANPDSNLDLLPPTMLQNPFLFEGWKPVKDVLGIDESEFYRRVLSESPACFDIVVQE